MRLRDSDNTDSHRAFMILEEVFLRAIGQGDQAIEGELFAIDRGEGAVHLVAKVQKLDLGTGCDDAVQNELQIDVGTEVEAFQRQQWLRNVARKGKEHRRAVVHRQAISDDAAHSLKDRSALYRDSTGGYRSLKTVSSTVYGSGPGVGSLARKGEGAAPLFVEYEVGIAIFNITGVAVVAGGIHRERDGVAGPRVTTDPAPGAVQSRDGDCLVSIRTLDGKLAAIDGERPRNMPPPPLSSSVPDLINVPPV